MNHQRGGAEEVGIPDLSDDLIGTIFQFLGPGQFLFVAGTSRQFYRVYETTMGENDNDDTTETTMRSAVESISRLQWARENGYPRNADTCALQVPQL